MSIQILGISGELADDGICFNGLWPMTFIASAKVQILGGGDDVFKKFPENTNYGRCLYVILTSCSKKTNGNSSLIMKLSSMKTSPNIIKIQI